MDCRCQASLSCPPPTPWVYSNSCPLSRWCYQTISSSVVPFSSRLQSFLASGSSQMSQFFTSGGQSIGVSASASVLPMNIQDWFDLLAVQETFKSLLQHHSSKASILWCSAFFIVQLSHPYMTTGKTIALTRWTFIAYILVNKDKHSFTIFIVLFKIKLTPKHFHCWEFPGGSVVSTGGVNRWGLDSGSIPGAGTKLPQAAWHS